MRDESIKFIDRCKKDNFNLNSMDIVDCILVNCIFPYNAKQVEEERERILKILGNELGWDNPQCWKTRIIKEIKQSNGGQNGKDKGIKL